MKGTPYTADWFKVADPAGLIAISCPKKATGRTLDKVTVSSQL